MIHSHALCVSAAVRPLVQSVGQSLCTLPPADPSECGLLHHMQAEGSVTKFQRVKTDSIYPTFAYQDIYFIYRCLDPIPTALEWK